MASSSGSADERSSGESFSSDDENTLPFYVKSGIPEYADIALLLSREPFVTSAVELHSSMTGCHFLACDEKVLALLATVDISELNGAIAPSVLKQLLQLNKDNGGSACLLFFSRMLNIPLSYIHRLYSAMRETDGVFLMVSTVERQSKTALTELQTLFPERNRKELEYFPKRPEESAIPFKAAARVAGSGDLKYDLFVLNRKQLNDFLRVFKQEIS